LQDFQGFKQALAILETSVADINQVPAFAI
jgi:hypothetical protein